MSNAAHSLADQLREIAATDRAVVVVEAPPSPRLAPRWIDTAAAAAELGMSRSTLDQMVARAPANLPGAPTILGTGTQRLRRRWDAHRLHSWFEAYGRWAASQTARPAGAKASTAFEPPEPAPRPRRAEGPRGRAGAKNKRPSLLALVSDGER